MKSLIVENEMKGNGVDQSATYKNLSKKQKKLLVDAAKKPRSTIEFPLQASLSNFSKLFIFRYGRHAGCLLSHISLRYVFKKVKIRGLKEKPTKKKRKRDDSDEEEHDESEGTIF